MVKAPFVRNAQRGITVNPQVRDLFRLAYQIGVQQKGFLRQIDKKNTHFRFALSGDPVAPHQLTYYYLSIGGSYYSTLLASTRRWKGHTTVCHSSTPLPF